MGTQTMTSYVVSSSPIQMYEQDSCDYSMRSGVASLGMKAQIWWIRHTGFDGIPGKIQDWKRRESRRRGEELFRHDVDNFELCCHNLIGAPGARPHGPVRGRGKYGHHGRTCGYGTGGAKKRGRRTVNPGFEGGNAPMQHRIPKLDKMQLDSMRKDPYCHMSLFALSKCENGEEVDYFDMLSRGAPVGMLKMKTDFQKVKVTGTDDDVFEVKNLTVYAHAFEPPAREKIEKNGGRCIRLSEIGNLPIDENALKVNLIKIKVAGEDDGPAAASE